MTLIEFSAILFLHFYIAKRLFAVSGAHEPQGRANGAIVMLVIYP
jgi:hypothetical protein